MTPFSFANITKALNEMKEKLEEEQNKEHPHQEAMSDHESQAHEHKDNRFDNPKTSGKHHMLAYHAHMDAADHLEYNRTKEAKASAKKAVFHAKKAKELGGEDHTAETNRIFKVHHSSTNESTLYEGEDVCDKFGIQITKTRLKGGIGYQINYGERGRYIQVLSKDMNNLMKAMQTAMKAK